MLKNAFWLFIVTFFLLVVFLPSYSKMQDLRTKNADYDEQIEYLTQKQKELEEEVHLLRTDPVYLEKVAREKMGLIKEGEVVYKITPAGPPEE